MDQLSNFQISLKSIKYLSPKVSEGLQLIFIVSGNITIEIDSRYYELREQDLLVINRHQLYEVQGNESNYVLLLTISDSFIDQYYSDYRSSRFECYSQEVDMGREKMLDDLRKLMMELMIANSRRDESYQIEMQSYLCEILLILIRGFKQKGSTIEPLDTDDSRIRKIVDYLEMNYYQVCGDW